MTSPDEPIRFEASKTKLRAVLKDGATLKRYTLMNYGSRPRKFSICDLCADPFLFNLGDMGSFVKIIERRDDGFDWLRKVKIPRTALFTGRFVKNTPELDTKRERDPQPHEIPTGWRWPASLGVDPRYRETAIA